MLFLKGIIFGLLSSIAMCQELGILRIKMGNREHCLAEELLKDTVLLVRFSGFLRNSQTDQKANAPFHYMVSVKDPNGTTISRQQVKPDGKVLMTAPMTGEYLVCMQTMLVQFSPHIYSELGIEVFIGDAGDPNITAPVEAKLNDLSFHIGKANELVADVQREQALHREREQQFLDKSASLNKSAMRWPIFQATLVILTALWQMHHLRKFFRAKKLV